METGLIGMLEGKEINVGLADLSYTYSRSQVTKETGVLEQSTNKYRDKAIKTGQIVMLEG